MSDEAEREIAGGPLFIVGQQTWEGWKEHERDTAIISCRMGLMVRIAELQLLPGASGHDSDTVIPILELVQDMMRRANVDQAGLAEGEQRARIETATIAAANSFEATPEITEVILSLTPGTTMAVRRSAFGRWITLAEAKGMVPAGLSSEEHRRIAVYGYALGVIRELLMDVQARDG